MRNLSTISIAAGVLLLSLSGCMKAYRESVGANLDPVVDRIFLTDFNIAWASALESLKNSRLDVSNREGGFLQTKWTDNTAEKNSSDSFGTADAYLRAQYRVRVTVAKTAYNGHPSVRVTVQKEQLVQRDVLEGWRPIESDGIDENTLIYRISRLIFMKMKITQLEEQRIQEQIRKSEL